MAKAAKALKFVNCIVDEMTFNQALSICKKI